MIPTPHLFSRRAAKALANSRLQATFARTTGKFLGARNAAFAELPDGEALRDRVAAVRDEALLALDVHLARFVVEAEKAGAVVHVADDAAMARAIAARIAKDEGVSLAVKSKSMVTEEVALNDGLASGGVVVIESDLGEYIVQLAEEPPSHLVAPAVHKTKEEVAELFASKLGEKSTGEIPELVGIARRKLREIFLSAGMGISGANFLVAETGTVVLATNEGNGRMTTTLPRVHLVVAGIEKVVPRMEDVPLLLRALTRSATGQKSTTYFSFLTGPKRAGDPQGPEKMHIILVDNGRSAILAGKYRAILRCLRCGACLNACPVYQSVGGHAYGWVYPGPMGSVLTPLLTGLYGSTRLPDASTLCGACAEVCPAKIPLPDLLLELRFDARMMGLKRPEEILAAKALALATRRAGLLEAIQRVAGLLAEIFVKDRKVSWMPGRLGAWTAKRDLPAPAPVPFRKLWRKARGIGPWTR